MIWLLLGINQLTYTRKNSNDAFVRIEPTEGLSEITFPYAVPGTNLVIEALVYYDGPFLENGSDLELFNSVALLLRNTSAQGITEAEITMQGNLIWCFRAMDISPNATVLVVESGGAKYEDNHVTACTGWSKVEPGGWDPEKYLYIDSPDIGTVCITNITDTELTGIRLLYKNWLPQNEIYVGGITYEFCIERIAAGQTVTLRPEHYVKGYSRFIKIYAGEI